MNKRILASIFLLLIGTQGLFAHSLPRSDEKPYKLVVCAVFQDESFFLREWLEFHRLMGVEHFYLYNNCSTDNYLEILTPYIQAGTVDLFEWSIETHNQHEYLTLLQLPAYSHALSLAKNTAEWAAFIDLDEFLFPVHHRDLAELLASYRSYAALAVNWQVYGTSWLEELPQKGLITENLLLKADAQDDINRTVKLIVQPEKVSAIDNPHYFSYLAGEYAVDSNKEAIPLETEGKSIVIDVIRINHYWFGTKNFFKKCKIPRREKWGFCLDEKVQKFLLTSCNAVYDDVLLQYAEILKQRMVQ
jgi:hypothetical protein